jgi:hypothetical protein
LAKTDLIKRVPHISNEEQPERLGYGPVIGLIGGDDSNDVYFPWGIA